jgi:hypothetical protein
VLRQLKVAAVAAGRAVLDFFQQLLFLAHKQFLLALAVQAVLHQRHMAE